MRVVDLIRAKRDGGSLTPEGIASFVSGAASGSGWADYQLAAMLMAIACRGMTAQETAALTRAMADSGTRFDLSGIDGPKIDKHSTGGVGDKASLILGPLAAACGVVVPMMSGRGLGHSGGTLDKLESIPGFQVRLAETRVRDSLRKVGLALFGQTAEIAPADRKLYALRDVTATVESIPLITASILSKKLTEGISGLVMDVKCGRGAFMKTLDDARRLARSLATVGTANGLKMSTFITAMDEPLGRSVGNSLEVIEAIEALRGEGPEDLTELSVRLAARMVLVAGLAKDEAEAERQVRAALDSGRGLEVFRRCVEMQGGDPRVIDHRELLPIAPKMQVIPAGRTGFIQSLDAEAIGTAAMRLGGGRERAEDAIDHSVGLLVKHKTGEHVTKGDPLIQVFFRRDSLFESTRRLLESSILIGDAAPAKMPLILEKLA